MEAERGEKGRKGGFRPYKVSENQWFMAGFCRGARGGIDPGFPPKAWTSGRNENIVQPMSVDLFVNSEVAMPMVKVTYPAFAKSREPRPLSASSIWQIGRQVRLQLLGRLTVEPFGVEVMIRRCKKIMANGVSFELVWDRDSAIVDGNGQPAFGVTELDANFPDVATIYINPELIAGRAEVERATAAHELGHAIFDAPSLVQAARSGRHPAGSQDARRYRSGWAPAGSRNADGTMNWSEYRANEFMGGMLVPPDLLHEALVGLIYNWLGRLVTGTTTHAGVVGVPALGEFDIDPDGIDALIDTLSEQFGVSRRFIEVRLLRYRLIPPCFSEELR